MAENCDRAFGRYLRTLRERRGLTLDDVSSLSQTFPESIGKGYLSRCENGHQKPAFSKVIALSRIYEVPADVLVERMELDMELDRVGGPDTAGLSFASLNEHGRAALDRGFFWQAYGYIRDGAPLAATSAVRPQFRDLSEQVVVAQQNIATAAKALGRIRFALHEFRHAEETGTLSPEFHALVLERIACCYRFLKDLDAAESYSNRAVREAESCSHHDYLGHIYSTRARIALARSRPELAIAYYQRAHEAHRSNGFETECARVLNNLAQCYFDQKRYAAARRAAEASMKFSTGGGLHRIRALSLIMLGELSLIDDKAPTAVRHWRKAATIAKQLDDKELRFRAEFALYKCALRSADHAVARALRRRLTKLSSWLPKETDDLDEFKSLSTSRLNS